MYVAERHVCWITFGLIHTLDKLGISEAKKQKVQYKLAVLFIKGCKDMLGQTFSKMSIEFFEKKKC